MNSISPLYSLHERIWHWLQAAAVLLLILTGLAIHCPDRFRVMGSMANAIRLHSLLGFAMILNAFLGIFYHVTAEKYHHFLPRMDDFTGAALRQARFYAYGIFKGEKHPLDADPRRKLNPLQKITYLALLNILLPFQFISGLLLWGADRWPQLFDKIGGLWVLAPTHTLGAYLLSSFLIGHIYLMTTGAMPWSLLRAMTTGYQDAEPVKLEKLAIASISSAEAEPATAAEQHLNSVADGRQF
jgi:thiosulfate reductase cytochrome b subunit